MSFILPDLNNVSVFDFDLSKLPEIDMLVNYEKWKEEKRTPFKGYCKDCECIENGFILSVMDERLYKCSFCGGENPYSSRNIDEMHTVAEQLNSIGYNDSIKQFLIKKGFLKL